jgi:ring-1,2-phenylacetyl-CoA epoxidase subunit PaaE
MTTLQITHIQVETPDTKTFHLKNTSGEKINYQAGQFLTLLFTINGKEIRRSYSLSSSPEVDDALSITVKRVANGEISRYLHDKMRVGDTLKCLPPTGRFVLPKAINSVKHYVFIVAGSGIVPVFAQLKTLIHSGFGGKISLIYQTTKPSEAIFYDKIAAYTEGAENTKVLYFFSRLKDNQGLTHLNKERLEQFLKNHVTERKRDVAFYLCGPTDYMRMATMTLHVHDFSDKHIHNEDFVIPTIYNDYILKDFGKPTQLTIHFQNKTYHIEVPFRKTLLDAALEHKIALPYSCKGGACTTCLCKTTKGQVAMPSNYKLFEAEMRQGTTLSCIAYADSEEVEIYV